MTRTLWLIAVFICCRQEFLFAANFRPTLVSGLMQQPSSQFYNYVQGGQLDVARNDDAGLIRGQYLERPAFYKAGFIDQDFSAAIMFGTSVLKWKDLGVTALIGGGQAWGYIKEVNTENAERNAYRLPGLSTALEGRWSLKHFDMRITHQMMICQNSQPQLKAYVAWPFTWILFSVSSPISF